MSPTKLISGTTGINNIDPVNRLKYDKRTKLTEVAEAMNVDIDNSYLPVMRDGFSLIESGSFKDAHRNGQDVFSRKNGTDLVSISVNGSIKIADVENRKIYFTNVANRTYFNNGVDLGYIENKIVHSWDAGDVVGAETTMDISGPPLMGSVIFYHRGIMYMAIDNILYHSDPFSPNIWNLSESFFIFNSKIKLITGLDKVLYISDENEIIGLVGGGPKEMERIELYPHPAVAGTESILRGFGSEDKSLVLVANQRVLSISGVNILDITGKKVHMPSAISYEQSLLLFTNLGEKYVKTFCRA